jgi:hypothetical protein
MGSVADPSCGEFTLVARPGVGVYSLPHAFIRAGTDSIWTASRGFARGSDYVIDRLRGQLRLLHEAIPGDTLHVRACWLISTPPLELELATYRPGSSAPDDSARRDERRAVAAGAERPPLARDPSQAPSGASLTLSGNKTIAVDFGSNQDAFLRQSLDLTVSGTLAPGVELTGVLSDRNTPLTASGTTQRLEALDKVLIELKAPQGGAALGDLSLDLERGELGRLDRRLQGVRGEWSVMNVRGFVAAASAPGEYRRIDLIGIEGRQGPYLLTDRDGASGVSIVAGSEIVTLDGTRLTRGEGADYSIDYENARVTFTNRRPITSASRITVEYQYSVNRYRRNLVAAGLSGQRGLFQFFAHGISEGDDRGRPLDVTFGPADRAALAAAGDSSSRAYASGVAVGPGDYHRVDVDSSAVYVFAGVDSGEYAVQFVRVGDGRGAYADSSVVDGRVTYRFVGGGKGAFNIGRALPLPESHRLWVAGGSAQLGAVALELEGAVSQFDRNEFSSLDDRDNLGRAGRAAFSLAGAAPGLGGTAGVSVRARATDLRYAPFERLERPFAEEDWGVPLGADLEHQRRYDLGGFWKPRPGGELNATLSRLALPDGFRGTRSELAWSRDGRLGTRARFENANGTTPSLRFSAGGRRHALGDLRLRLAWIEPALRIESDERRTPSDTGRVGDRFREAGFELASGAKIAWHLVAGYALRRDARAAAVGFEDVSESRTLRLSSESPAERWLGVGVTAQHRELETLVDHARIRSDLGSVRLRAEEPRTRLRGRFDVEVTSEAENLRDRKLTYVGPGRGAYDALGNFVGTGDYDLVSSVSPELARVGRAATSALLSWPFGTSEAWRGSRVEFDFESELRRRGELKGFDAVASPGSVRGDPDVAGGSVLQRIETELAPGSRFSALRLRAERRVTADRSYQSFAQTVEDRTLSARWRTRPGSTVSTEIEARARRQDASQSSSSGGSYQRALIDHGGTGQLVYTPDARLRAAAVLELSWSRPELATLSTRTIRVGPDAGIAVGARGHAEIGVRRAFVSGAPPVGLLPTADPIGPPRWEANTRFDYRVRESATFGLSLEGRDRPERAMLVTGRAELKAYF